MTQLPNPEIESSSPLPASPKGGTLCKRFCTLNVFGKTFDDNVVAYAFAVVSTNRF